MSRTGPGNLDSTNRPQFILTTKNSFCWIMKHMKTSQTWPLLRDTWCFCPAALGNQQHKFNRNQEHSDWPICEWQGCGLSIQRDDHWLPWPAEIGFGTSRPSRLQGNSTCEVGPREGNPQEGEVSPSKDIQTTEHRSHSRTRSSRVGTCLED